LVEVNFFEIDGSLLLFSWLLASRFSDSKLMRSIFWVLIFQLCSLAVFSQATFTTTGSWDNTVNWSGANIGDLVTENVTINNNRSALINNGFNYTIGNLTIGNNSGLTINTTGVLNVGNSTNSRNLTATNGAAITVTGTLIIWGDLIVVNNLSLNVSGTLIVKGNIQMNNGASISVTGSVDVDGDFIAGNIASVSISGGGSVNVDGTVTIGQNGNLTGPPGSFTAGGCGQGSGSNFCNGGVLPVDLLYFRAEPQTDRVKLVWETASELNADYFEVEKSSDGLTYEFVARLQAVGNSSSRILYQVNDEKPQFGKSYYRLKQADVDGTIVIFNVVLVDFDGSRNASLYPNPIQNGTNLSLELNFNPQLPLEVIVYDLSGKVQYQTILRTHAAEWPVNLKAGLYVMRVASPEYQGTMRFSVSE
jgi:hypothetical protein